MNIGVTATQEGMSECQKTALRKILHACAASINEFHHGDCVGGDADAHAIAIDELGADRVFIHPPDNPKKRAYCQSVAENMSVPKPYLVRNQDIIDASTVILGAPKSMERPSSLRGQGTWWTITHAEQAGKTVLILKR